MAPPYLPRYDKSGCYMLPSRSFVLAVKSQLLGLPSVGAFYIAPLFSRPLKVAVHFPFSTALPALGADVHPVCGALGSTRTRFRTMLSLFRFYTLPPSVSGHRIFGHVADLPAPLFFSSLRYFVVFHSLLSVVPSTESNPVDRLTSPPRCTSRPSRPPPAGPHCARSIPSSLPRADRFWIAFPALRQSCDSTPRFPDNPRAGQRLKTDQFHPCS